MKRARGVLVFVLVIVFYDALLVDEKAAADDAHGSLLAELLLLPDSVGLDRL